MSAWWRRRSSFKLLSAFVAVMMVLALAGTSKTVYAAYYEGVQVTLEGYNIKTTGPDAWTGEYVTGNLGKSYAEGEWYPGRAEFTGVQTNYPGLVGFPDIHIEYDSVRSLPDGYAIFVDLVKGIQVGGRELGSDEGWPMANGDPYPVGTPALVNTAQNHQDENAWDDYALLNLPIDQVNRSAMEATYGEVGSIYDETRMFTITGDQLRAGLTAAGVPLTTDTFYVYFEFHLARTSIWGWRNLQEYYADPAEDPYYWGGYLYGLKDFDPIAAGSSPYTGSSGHFTMSDAARSVPLPDTPEVFRTVTGMKFLDADYSHSFTAGDTGLPGWTINLVGYIENIMIPLTTTTDINGVYSFEGLSMGSDLEVHEVLESGFIQTYPYEMTLDLANGAHPINVVEAGKGPWRWEIGPTLSDTDVTISGIDFGNLNTGKIRAHKEDSFGTDLAGWEFNLWKDADKNGSYETPINGTLTTLANGYTPYWEGLLVGNYKVIEVLKPGWAPTNPSTGEVEIVLQAGQTAEAEFVNEERAKIRAYKEDSFGTVLEGWEFKLYKDNNEDGIYETQIGDAKTTDSYGYTTYWENLVPGLYQIVETPKTGWVPITPADGSYEKELVAGETAGVEFTAEFTNEERAKIRAYKEDSFGTALEGWEFKLYKDNNEDGIYETQIGDAKTTDSYGYTTYWENLVPGLYQIVETPKTGWVPITPADGSYEKELVAGETAGVEFTAEFTNEERAKIRAYKEDSFGTALEGWEFKLYKDNNEDGIYETQIGDAKTTDSYGYTTYWENLVPGLYQIVETPKTGWVPITPADGSYEKELVAGETAGVEFTAEFTNEERAKIRAYKEDSFGTALEGWEFKLYKDNNEDGIYETQIGDAKTTDSYGYTTYWENLVPGLYQIVETPKTGWVPITPADGSYEKELVAGETAGVEFTAEFTNEERAKIRAYKEDSFGTALEGWEFKLYKDSNEDGIYETQIGDAKTTDSYGYTTYWENLVPGLYQIVETPKTGWVPTTPADGSYEKELVAGETAGVEFTAEFTNEERGTICAVKVNTLEVVLGGWEFKLYKWNEDTDVWDLISAKTTNLSVNDGKVCWPDMTPGVYKLVETPQTGWIPINPATGFIEFELVAGETAGQTFLHTFMNQAYTSQTAWGYLTGYAMDFRDNTVFNKPKFSNWGWTNGPLDVSGTGEYVLRMYAGAGGTPLNESPEGYGTYVGDVIVSYNAGVVTVTYEIDDPPFILDAAHLYVGVDRLPKVGSKETVSPGKLVTPIGVPIDFTSVSGYDGFIYVAAHAVVIVPGD